MGRGEIARGFEPTYLLLTVEKLVSTGGKIPTPRNVMGEALPFDGGVNGWLVGV